MRINRSPTKSEIWAAVIGINDYQNSGIPDLDYAVADAGAVYDYLHNNMKVPQDHIFTLYNKQAGKQEVEKILGDILPKKARPQDTVIIYYSGHGAPYPDPSSPDGDGVSKYLLTSDTDPESMWATAVEMESIRKIFNRLSSERVVFLADTCYSGASGGKSFA
ncbi:caspase family protein [Desulfosarcina sp. BuS5]|uniref:caspase family protein n=1 Tax=Desulfosarcina sp. BuS5 TaxID=933262 RepID=UPI000A0107FF